MKAQNLILNNESYPLLQAESNTTGNSGLKLSTGDGYIMFGPLNTSHAHIQTDRSNFYFNKKLMVNTGIVTSYDEDLYLRRADNSSHQIQIGTTGITNSLKTTFSAGLNGQAIFLSGAQNFDNIKDIGFYSLYNVNASGSVNAPFQYGTMISTNSNASGGMGMQLAHERTGAGFYVRGMNDSGDTWYDWDEIWTSGTDGSGSGLDADLLDGYHLSTTRNSANTVPVRDGNGYLNLGWINTTSGNTTSSISDIYINTGDNYVRKASKSHFISNLGLWTSTNDGSGSGLDADTVDGKHASDFMADEFLDAAYVDFTVNGNADTYYPVSIRGGGKFAYQMYSISRQYNWTAPNTWNTASHRGGLTLTWQYSGDGFWGGNDHDVRIIKWDETYSTIVAGMQGSVGGGGTNAGVVVWLRGGGALYRFHGPQASAGDVNIHLSSVTASNSTVFAPRSLNTTTRDNELLPKYPIRGQSTLYDNNNRVWNPANDGPGSGLDADTVDGIQASSTIHKLNNTGYYRPNTWIDFRDAGTAGLYWGAGTAAGWHLYPQNTGLFAVRSGNTTYVQVDLMAGNSTRRGSIYADSSNNVGILDSSGHWAVRHINHSGTEFRKDNTIIAGIGTGEVSGDYGSMVVRDAKNGWYGYSINNQWVFMANGATNAGIYNDTDNEWAVKTTRNAATELMYNGGVRLATTSGGVYVTGEVEASNFRAYTGGQSIYYTSSGNIRGYIGAFESGPHFRIATSGNEQIGFYDGGTGGTLNVLIEGAGHLDLKTGNLNMNGTTVIDTSRVVKNVTLGYGSGGARFQISGWIESNDGNDRMYFASGSTSYWRCGGSGSHIWRNGSDVSRAELDTNGNFIAEGNVTAYGSASDIRIKENIEVIQDSVEKVKSLRGVTFNYKKDGKRSTGLVAQELQKVLPEAVYETKDSAEDGEDILAIRYGNVVGLLVEALKEQQTQIDSLTNLVNELKEK